MISSAQIIEVARETLDTPWIHQGRLVGVGIDCIGLLVHVAKRLEIPHEDYTAYSQHPNPEQFIERLSNCKALQREPTQFYVPGQVAVFWIRHEKEPTHVGIFTNHGIIHTYQSVGRVLEHRLTENWAKRIHSVWSFKGWQRLPSESLDLQSEAQLA